MTPKSPSTCSPPRPNWMLLVIAIAFGMPLGGLAGSFTNPMTMPDWMHWLLDLTLLQQHGILVLFHVVLPSLFVFAVLKSSRLGSWLAPNRLALAWLVLADMLLVGVYVQYVWAVLAHDRSMMPSAILEGFALASLAVALGILLGSTLWHRLVIRNDKASVWCRSLLREV